MSLIKNFNIIVYLTLLCFYSFISRAAQDNLNNDLATQIENNLLADDQNSYTTFTKNDFVIDATKSHNLTKSEDKKVIDILVEESNLKPRDVDTRTKEKIAYNATLSKQYEVAIELYKQVIVVEPENYYAMFSLATIYQKLHQFRQAKLLYYHLLTADLNNKEAITDNILSLLIEESPQESLYLMSRLATQNPNSAYILAKAALAYSEAKNYAVAINFMKKSISIKPDNLRYKYDLAIIYDKAQNYEEALKNYSLIVKEYNNSNALNQISLEQIKRRIISIENKA